MMNNDEEKYKEYFEILELEENASLADINQAYKKLTELYSSESMVTDPIEDEFSLEERQQIVNQLEEAYKALLRYIVEKDRDIKEIDKKEEELEDTAKEEEEEEEEEEEVDILELMEEVKIVNHESPEDTLSEEDFKTIPSPKDFPEKKEETTINVHENVDVHEPVHIELPEQEERQQKKGIQDENLQETAFEIISTDVDEHISENKVSKNKYAWDESLFEKDIVEIKEELTRDIKDELTIAQKKPGDEQPVKEGFEGVKIKGRSLRKIREKLGIGIHEIAVASKINYKILVNIEKERFSKLPDAGHLRWYLTRYAKALFLDPQQVANQYMKRYRQWKRQKGEL